MRISDWSSDVCSSDLKRETHDAAMVDSAIARAHAYAEAGASGFFVPGLGDLALLERVCRASPLPVNFMAYPGAPSAAEVAREGVARISHGPFPYYLALEAFRSDERRVGKEGVGSGRTRWS